MFLPQGRPVSANVLRTRPGKIEKVTATVVDGHLTHRVTILPKAEVSSQGLRLFVKVHISTESGDKVIAVKKKEISSAEEVLNLLREIKATLATVENKVDHNAINTFFS